MGCGCEERKEILGLTESQWWNRVIVVGSITILLLTKGGKVTAKTQKLVTIGMVGAVTAILIDGVLKPRAGVK